MELQRRFLEDKRWDEPDDPGRYQISAIVCVRGDRESASGCRSTMARLGQVVAMDRKEFVTKNPGIERPS